MTFQIRRASLDDYLRDHPLKEFFVPHLSVTADHVRAFKDCLDSATDELPLQTFLETNPIVLVQHLRTSGRFSIPRKRFGAEFVSDFVIGEHHSFGYDWQVVELDGRI